MTDPKPINDGLKPMSAEQMDAYLTGYRRGYADGDKCAPTTADIAYQGGYEVGWNEAIEQMLLIAEYTERDKIRALKKGETK